MPQSIYSSVENGVFTFCLRANVKGAKYPFLVFRSKDENSIIQRLQVEHRENDIDPKTRYQDYEKLADTGHNDLIEIITDKKEGYKLFLKSVMDFNSQFGAKKEKLPRPNESFDLLRAEYFEAVREEYFVEHTRDIVDDVTNEMLDYLQESFIKQQIEEVEEILTHLEEYGVYSASELNANKRYYNWLNGGERGGLEINYYNVHEAMGHFDKDELEQGIDERKMKKLKWKGNLTEFLELLVTLQDRGWLEPVRKGSFPKTANAILQAFEFSGSDDPHGTLVTYLKGEMIDGERLYRFNTSDEYDMKFDEIKANQ